MVGQRRVFARSGFLVDLHDAIEHPVGWRFIGLGGVVLDVDDGVAEERELSIAGALGQDDEPCVQLGIYAEAHEVGVVVRDEHEFSADGESQQIIVSHAELPAVACAGRLVSV
jgi:hypothetical protein